jgi:hypothetical protein
MADAYGSTLDSLMANKVAQQSAQQAEANSYRNFLNQVSNTNLRRREGEALDRRGMEELGINRMNVSGLNDYRRGQVDIGMEDARTRRYEGETGRENVGGLNRFREGQVDIGRTDAGSRRLDTESMGQYRTGLTQNEANRIQSGERLGMRGFDTSERNVGRQSQALEYGAEAGVRSTGIQAGANMFDSSNRLEAAQLQYDRLPRGEQLAYNQGGLEGLQQYRSATNPGSENMRIMRLSNQQEQDAQRRSAYGATMDQLDKDFESEASGFSSWIPNSNRTEQILAEQKRLQRRGMSEADAYDAALGTVSRNIVDARFGQRPGVDDILRDDRYDVPRNPSGQPPRTPNLSEPGLAPTNTVPGRVFIPRGRGISRPIQQPSRGNWPPNE